MPWLKSSANWFPKTEEVQPEEIRVTFMGGSMPRPGQMGTSVYVNRQWSQLHSTWAGLDRQLPGGCVAKSPERYLPDPLALDHVDSVAYTYMFGAWAGRWQEPLRITGPSSPEYGVRYMMDRMKEMLTWHRLTSRRSVRASTWRCEFDFRDDGGVAYEKDGVKITHWPVAHRRRCLSVRLDWKDMCVAFTGGVELSDHQYAAGCDALLEVQPELMAIAAAVNAMPVIAATPWTAPTTPVTRQATCSTR
jgi:hypothetical protein